SLSALSLRDALPILSRRGGGVSEALRPLARQLDAEGLDVAVLGLADPADRALRGDWGNASVVTVGCLPPRPFGYAPELARRLERSEEHTSELQSREK